MKTFLFFSFTFLFVTSAPQAEELGRGETGDSGRSAPAQRSSNSPSQDLQDLVSRMNSFIGCSDKVWPGMQMPTSDMAVVDLDGSRWRIQNGNLVPATDLPTKISFNGGYAVNSNKTPREVILGLQNLKREQEMREQMEASAQKSEAAGQEMQDPYASPHDSALCKQLREKFRKQNKSFASGGSSSEPSLTDSAFMLGVHEGFHVCDQEDKWHYTSKQESGPRRSAYPAVTEPRQLRYKTKRAMMEALKTTDASQRQKYLQEAAYWHKLYKSKYGEGSANPEPHEAMDILEGSARYVEILANAVDCKKDISSAELAKISRKAILDNVGVSPEATYDMESYSLGALAGALLDQNQKQSPAWKIKLEKDKVSALDQLLGQVKPQRGALSAKEAKALDEISETPAKVAEECYAKPNMRQLANYKDDEYVWVSIPTQAFRGKGFYDGSSVIPGTSYVNIDSYASAGGVDVENQPLVQHPSNPCGATGTLMVLVKKSSIKGNRVNYDNSSGHPAGKVSGTINPAPRTSSSLGTVYCASN